MISNEILSAYIDGELPAGEMQRVRDAISDDEVLAARLRQFARVDRLVGEFCAGIDKQPLPDAVLALLQLPRREAEATTSKSNANGALPAWRNPVRLLALAASMVVAIVVGLRFGSDQADEFDFDRLAGIGPIALESPLRRVLQESVSDATVAVAADESIRVTPVLSFESVAGEFCREFSLATGTRALRAVACRRGDEWRNLMVGGETGYSAPAEGFATAASGTDAAFDAFVDQLMASAPMAADAESLMLRTGTKGGTAKNSAQTAE